jgi:hypothetical protein
MPKQGIYEYDVLAEVEEGTERGLKRLESQAVKVFLRENAWIYVSLNEGGEVEITSGGRLSPRLLVKPVCSNQIHIALTERL